VPHPRAHAVSSDQSACAALAYTQVHARGYRRIGFVSSPRFDRNTGSHFRAGFLRAQDDHAPASAHLRALLLDEAATPAVADQLRRWLARERPDAVITSHPLLAALLGRLGVRVPRDLAVATTSVLDGNFPAGIDQNCQEIGAVALRTLAGLIHQNERGIPVHYRRVLVEGRWVDGASLPPTRRVPAGRK
jgi:DNA-binding LacI/PurR family transcriptional regulator